MERNRVCLACCQAGMTRMRLIDVFLCPEDTDISAQPQVLFGACTGVCVCVCVCVCVMEGLRCISVTESAGVDV